MFILSVQDIVIIDIVEHITKYLTQNICVSIESEIFCAHQLEKEHLIVALPRDLYEL